MIAAGSKEERERISKSITEKCGKELEAKVQELRNPRLVIYNIPEDITLENATRTIREQNLELQLEEDAITAKRKEPGSRSELSHKEADNEHQDENRMGDMQCQ